MEQEQLVTINGYTEVHTMVNGRVHANQQQRRHLFRIGAKYNKLQCLGEGAYGVVVSANIKNINPVEKVAIKKIQLKDSNSGNMPMTRQQIIYFQSTLREVRILTRLQHENIIRIHYAYRMPSDGTNLQEIYLVQDLMGPDLYKLIHQMKQDISNEHIAFFTYQMIRGIKYIHSANVIHRDLKTQNILVNANCDLKICDFGMSRVLDETHDHRGALTEYVTTRWYRAPEIVVDPKSYSKAVDVWSIGCILGEMLTKRVIFPGSHYIHQLNLIFEALGRPNEEELNEVVNEQARTYIQNLNINEQQPIQFAPGTDTNAIDLMFKMLTFSPTRRIRVDDALAHEYVAEYYEPEDEPNAPDPFTRQDEIENPTEQQLIENLHDTTEAFMPELKA